MNPLFNSLMVRAADAPVIKPAVELGTPLLLTIAVAGVALLLLMIIRFKIQAFVALLTVSILVAVAAQIPLKDVFTVVANGVGSTLGKVAILIALGAVLGRMIEVSGGVQSLADHFTRKLGAKRVAVALTAVGFLVAIPVFFEVGIIVLVPIVYAFSKIANLHPVKFGLPGVRAQVDEFGSDSLVRSGHVGPGHHAIAPPRPGLIIFLIAAPITQILVGTVGTLVIDKQDYWYGVAAFFGNPFFALLVAVALSFFLLAVRRHWSLKETGEIFEGALPPIASILMVVAAGGVFGGVLQVSGIGAALSETLDKLGVPLLLLGFIISLALRAAQGSATVAIVTTTGLLSAAVANGGYTPAQIAVIVIAIGFGSLGLSHVTDADFWVVVRYYGLTVADGLKTWTVLTTVLGLAGFALTFVAWILVGGLTA